jgi:Flp pilus assembly protein CpaB
MNSKGIIVVILFSAILICVVAIYISFSRNVYELHTVGESAAFLLNKKTGKISVISPNVSPYIIPINKTDISWDRWKNGERPKQ